MGAVERLISFIKQHFVGEELSKFETDIVPTFKFGDIIFAERFCSDIDKDIMGDGHTTGPYVVIGTDRDRIIGCYCTSTESHRGNIEIGEGYQLFDRNKKSYVDTCGNIKTIDEKAFLGRHHTSLNELDQKKLLKALTLNGERYYYDFGKARKVEFDQETRFEAGDVVLCNNNHYLILRQFKNQDRFEVIPIKGYNEHHASVDFSEVDVYYDKKMILDVRDITYLNTIDRDHFAIILTNYQTFSIRESEISRQINKNEISVGALVKFNDNLYYITSVENDVAHGFFIRKGEFNSKYQVMLRKKNCQIFFDTPCDININDDNYNVKNVAYEDEMDQVRNLKKDYFKKHKVKEDVPKKTNRGLVVGDFVYNPINLTDIYLIVAINGKEMTVVPIKKLASNKIEYLTFGFRGFKKYHSITAIEMNMIKNKLAECNEAELKKVSKKKLKNK